MTRTRARRALLALYPAAWRRRHGDELLGHLDDEWGDARLPLDAGVDLVASAVTEHAHAAFDVAAGDRDATRGLRLVTWGWCSCVVGGIGFAKLAEHFASARFRPLGVPGGLAVASAAYDAVQWVSVLSGVLIALLVTPAALVAVAHGGPHVRRRLLHAASIAVVASASFAGYLAWVVVWAHELSFAQRNGGSGAYGLSVVGLALLGTLALGAWTNVANVALHAVAPASDGSAVANLARAAALCVAVLAAGAGLWLAAVAVDAPRFLVPGGLGSQWPYVLVPEALLVVGTVLSVMGAWFVPLQGRGADVTRVAA